MGRITTAEQLDAIYGAAIPAALVKEIDHISADYAAFIEKSPFVIVATVGPEGLDCSPRGDPPGFVRIENERSVLIPDRLGNNRIDALRNIVRDPRISLLFLIPGIGNTLRINGRAEILDDPELLRAFAMGEKLPRTVLRVTTDQVYFQCPKALTRGRIWDPAAQIARDALPSTGAILAKLSKGAIDAAAYDAAYPQRMKDTIY
ncbi:MAG: pyridoxamine 5'-phosphate oxidase family protein [Tagaea sp.]|nr:pyridoxamine 5'-phosphate oxidase family protein [Tagaea sp.]